MTNSWNYFLGNINYIEETWNEGEKGIIAGGLHLKGTKIVFHLRFYVK
jgi:hypothetical protein